MARWWMAAIFTATAFTPALAATEADCKAAIAALQDEMASTAAIEMRPDEWHDRINGVIAQAGYEGVEGRHDECLKLVDQARTEAGLRKS